MTNTYCKTYGPLYGLAFWQFTPTDTGLLTELIQDPKQSAAIITFSQTDELVQVKARQDARRYCVVLQQGVSHRGDRQPCTTADVPGQPEGLDHSDRRQGVAEGAPAMWRDRKPEDLLVLTRHILPQEELNL